MYLFSIFQNNFYIFFFSKCHLLSYYYTLLSQVYDYQCVTTILVKFTTHPTIKHKFPTLPLLHVLSFGLSVQRYIWRGCFPLVSKYQQVLFTCVKSISQIVDILNAATPVLAHFLRHSTSHGVPHF